jgi:hypothetical protein
VPSASPIRSLERFAASGRYDEAAAHGLCLHATVELGQEALRLGLVQEACFIRWRVQDDAHFQEHWALALAGDRVLDMTAVQVDGSPRHLRLRANYPANYVRPRLYPIPVVLDVIADSAPTGGPDGRYSRRLLWRLHLRLFRYDIAQAMVRRTPRLVASATGSLVRTAFTLSTGFVLERAIARMTRLLSRMDG